jgi:pyruvate,orthophosphate dikinase
MLHQVSRIARVDPAATPIATGLAVSPGVGVGVLCCDADCAADLSARGSAVVLARSETSPADVHGMVGAAGLLTTRGGVASHAAVVARSWAIPAITSLTGTEVHPTGLRIGPVLIAEGDLVTVDGTVGALYLGDRRAAGSHGLPEVLTLRE